MNDQNKFQVTLTPDEQVALANLGLTLSINEGTFKSTEDAEHPDSTIFECLEEGHAALNALIGQLPEVTGNK